MSQTPIAEFMEKNGRVPESVTVPFSVLNKCAEIISRLPASQEVRQVLDAIDWAVPSTENAS